MRKNSRHGWLLSAFVLLGSAGAAHAACTSDLTVYSDAVQGKKMYGFAYDGDFVIPAQFEEVAGNPRAPFCDGLAAVRKDGRWGYVDKRGRVVASFQFTMARPFQDGIGVAQRADGWVLLDAKGQDLCAGEVFFHVGRGTEGFLAVRYLGDDGVVRHGFVDGACKAVGAKRWDEVVEFQGGMAPVRSGERWTFLAKDGSEPVGAGPMTERPYRWNGYWSVQIDRKSGVVSSSGEVVLPAEYNGVSAFSGGYYGVRNEKSLWAYYDLASKKFITDFLFREVREFSEGLAAARTDEQEPTNPNVYGFVGTNGEWAIAPRYLYIERGFQNGKAIVWRRPNIYNSHYDRLAIDRTGTESKP